MTDFTTQYKKLIKDLNKEEHARQVKLNEMTKEFTFPSLDKFPQETYRQYEANAAGEIIEYNPGPMTRSQYLEFARQTTSDLLELIEKKNADYTQASRTDDFAANFRGSEDIGIPAIKGLHLRMSDKWQRVQSFQKTGNLKGESVKDAYLDMMGYSLLALALLEESSSYEEGEV